MKVSSTFDSIPFIAEYLQSEIERQVRRLFQEDLPVAVHRLSLRLWNPEYAASLGEEATAPARPLRFEGSSDEEDEVDDEDQFINPLLTPAENLDAPSTMFSQKNLQRLSSLVDSQKTLSLKTPNISDAVFRAWASGGTQNTTIWDRPGALEAPATPSAGPTAYAFSDNGDAESIISSGSSTRPSLASSRHVSTAGAPGRRKKKHRVVDLRKNKKKDKEAASSSSSEASTTPPTSESAIEDGFCERPLPIRRVREDSIDYDSDSRPTILPRNRRNTPTVPITLVCPSSPTESVATADITYPAAPRAPSPAIPARAPTPKPVFSAEKEKEALRAREAAGPRLRTGGILEQAILSKIMGEIQRSLEEERIKRGGGNMKWGVEHELEDLCGNDGLPAYQS